MARGPNLNAYMPRLVREYPSARQALAAWRRAGGHVEDAKFFALFSATRTQAALLPFEVGKSIRFRPDASEILSEPTVRASGIAHRVVIVGRLRSGEVIPTETTVPVGDNPISRAAAIKKAEEWARGWLSKEGPKRTDMVAVYGGVHVGVVRREPGL